jgi:phosphoglycerol transferase MdoB-like AlkP superfamily enzyme
MRKIVPFHPFLLAIYPVLSLWNTNIKDVPANQALRTFLLSLVIATCLVVVLRLLTRDLIKASLIASVLLIAFFSYGHLYDVLKSSGLPALLVRHRLLLPLILIMVAAFIVFIWRARRKLDTLTTFFNVVGIVLLAVPLIQITGYEIRKASLAEGTSPATASNQETQSSTAENTPDVYYIILDAYGREDMLKEFYGYDNSDLIVGLKQRGFYVADGSYSNYMQTVLSLGSSLNMSYLDALQAEKGVKILDYDTVAGWMMTSKVRGFLAQHGYKTVAFATSYAEMGNADIFLRPPYQQDSNAPLILPINEFEGLLMKSTMIRAWLDVRGKSNKLQDSFLEAPYIAQRNRILFTLTELKKVPAIPGKKFVFAHVVAPHPPFVFGSTGEAVQHTMPYMLNDGNAFEGSPEEYVSGYRDQAHYINKLVLQAVDAILANSSRPPIIIIQGDHGPGAHLVWSSVDKSNVPERMAILNAYYFPDGNYNGLYPSISPVNSFRVVFNKFFGTAMSLLPDNHFFSTYSEPTRFINVNDRLNTP